MDFSCQLVTGVRVSENFVSPAKNPYAQRYENHLAGRNYWMSRAGVRCSYSSKAKK